MDPSGYKKGKAKPFSKGNYQYDDIESINFNALLKGIIVDPPKGMIDPHVHHFPYKRGRGKRQQELVDHIQNILVELFGINPIGGEEVLCWAPNRVKGQHITKNLENYYAELQKIYNNGGTRENVVKLGRKYQKEVA